MRGVNFKVALRAQGKHDKKLGDMQTAINLEGEFSGGVDFFGQAKLVVETILKDDVLFGKISDVNGFISEYGEIGDFKEEFDPELTNQWIKMDSDYIHIGIDYIDASLLKGSSFRGFSLPSYPLWEVISQEGNVFHLRWNTENLARFLNENIVNDSFVKEMIWNLLSDLEEYPITMTVGDKFLTLSFIGENDVTVVTLSNSSLSIKYQYDSNLFYLIMKKGNTSDKLGFIIAENGVAQILGTFDIKIDSSSVLQKISIKGNIKALESTFKGFDVNIDYLGQTNALIFVDIQAPTDYLDLEEYYRGNDYWDDDYRGDDYEADIQTSEEYYDYYYAEEQAQYGKFCDSDDKNCALATKAEVLALPSCKAYFDSYVRYITQLDKSDQSYHMEEFLDELALLQEKNLNYANYFCSYYSDYYTE